MRLPKVSDRKQRSSFEMSKSLMAWSSPTTTSILSLRIPRGYVEMRVLVTGGSGYIGSATVHELEQNGHAVIIYDNLSTGHRKLSKGFELIEGDIADRSKILLALKRVDAIIHFAASAYVGESVTNPRKYFRNNVESALALMDSVLESDVRIFVFSSSCAVYGAPQALPI